MAAEPIEFQDRIELPSGIKRDANGNMVVPARVCRTGVYDYAGFELGKPELRRVRVYRPPEEVFNRDSMRSLAGVPVTIGHPGLIDPKNWKDHATGETSSDDIVRDGESIRVPFLLRDETAMEAVEDGKHELSPGYTAVIDWTAGQTGDGKEYDGIVRNIRYNHLAIVDRARGGRDCRIGDEAPTGVKTVETKMILLDGLSVETTEAGERAILKLVDERKTAIEDAADKATKLAAAEKTVGEKDGEIAALKQQLKDASDPKALQTAAAARSKLCDQAKALFPKIVTDNKTDAEIRKEVVTEILKDNAAALNDDGIATAFLTLAATKTAGTGPSPKGKDQLADALRSGSVSVEDDEDTVKLMDEHQKALDARRNRFETASRPAAETKE